MNKEVPQEVLNRIFEIAQKAPSNCNVQPWKVYVSGELKDKLKRKMVENVTSGVEANPDYPYRSTFENEYRKRQVDCAVALYSSMDIGRDDKEGRMRASLRNFEFLMPYVYSVHRNESAFGYGSHRCRYVGSDSNVDDGKFWFA